MGSCGKADLMKNILSFINFSLITLFCALCLQVGCGDDGQHLEPPAEQAKPSKVGTSEDAIPVVWESSPPMQSDISLIIKERCSGCHSAFLEEDKASEKAGRILELVSARIMPFADSLEARSITDIERELIVSWANAQE